MGFADKKGITVASGFKLQAGALLDARGQVETLAERDELVTLNAVTAGLQVYVKENKTAYVYNGTGWDEVPKGNMSGTLDGYVSKEEGKGLSSNDYTDEEKAKVAAAVPSARKVNGKALTADVTLAAADVGAVPATAKGAAGGVAELDSTGKVPAAQLPSYVDDVIEGYLSGGKLYEEAAHTTEIAGESGKIYVDLATSKTYRWSGTAFAVISDTVALGETSSTAYRGDRGKTAYEHSQAAHAPANAEANVQSDWNETDASSDAYIRNKPSSLPADGGDAATVNGHTVGADVPSDAKFTDTVYSHPSTHPASMISQDATHRFVSDTEKEAWNAKATVYFAEALPASAPAGSVCFLVS
ncbi:hypothetical protein BRYFOR_07557 [Marvinbryantia formatexigens DSM 14469]|uniref:Uncharacterized protein n=1 Tax=Marvinbryantia formatexigens DSM 14469 TaxID=478749 RepID=C6LFZ7_9FIRM|nr:hypothetical protein [Marvinbryantia formatexigens]EET60361.1 hypothetical protein BRYFOR_07557 [Marvinbryantia formatexigens DSM 14469]UWO25299.1 hypothetical protein NQ534_02050 [Marvinbryantia formatexigens DSM 14469]SDG98211.1 hypothetical protein SAMN05660368_03623 [Marvinbryantia formatexigens]